MLNHRRCVGQFDKRFTYQISLNGFRRTVNNHPAAPRVIGDFDAFVPRNRRVERSLRVAKKRLSLEIDRPAE